jgi:hypothetical protein
MSWQLAFVTMTSVVTVCIMICSLANNVTKVNVLREQLLRAKDENWYLERKYNDLKDKEE